MTVRTASIGDSSNAVIGDSSNTVIKTNRRTASYINYKEEDSLIIRKTFNLTGGLPHKKKQRRQLLTQ